MNQYLISSYVQKNKFYTIQTTRYPMEYLKNATQEHLVANTQQDKNVAMESTDKSKKQTTNY